MLTVGKKVVYPCQGPCLIAAVVKKTVDDRPVKFYQLLVLNDGSGSLFVPVDKVEAVRIRPLLEKSEIPKLLGRLRKSANPSDNSRQRTNDNLRLLATGCAFDLAEVVESLNELSETKALSFGETKLLEKAKRLLVCEVSEVMEETKEEAEEQIDKALRSRNKTHKTSAATAFSGGA